MKKPMMKKESKDKKAYAKGGMATKKSGCGPMMKKGKK